MQKDDVRDSIRNLERTGVVSREELLRAYDEGAGSQPAPEPHHETEDRRQKITTILYYIGALVVFSGIGVLVFQNWNTLGASMRLLVTFVPAVFAYFLGWSIHRRQKDSPAGGAFHVIAALVFPTALLLLPCLLASMACHFSDTGRRFS